MRAVTSLREAAGLTNQQLFERADMSPSYYWTRLRGDAPFDTNDIERLAAVLSTHPHEISRLAASLEVEDEIEPHTATVPAELARRLHAMSDAPRLDGSPFVASDLVSDLNERGVNIDAGEWAELLNGRGPESVRDRVLIGIAEYAGVPAAYLTDLNDEEAVAVAEAQFDFRSALVESGADSVSARAVGDVSPSALRAIARSLRSIPPR